MKTIRDLLDKKIPGQNDGVKYISREFQDYGCRLAEDLGDLKHKGLYIKLAKEKPRAILEKARSFAIDYPSARNKGKIFMWKLKELCKTIDRE